MIESNIRKGRILATLSPQTVYAKFRYSLTYTNKRRLSCFRNHYPRKNIIPESIMLKSTSLESDFLEIIALIISWISPQLVTVRCSVRNILRWSGMYMRPCQLRTCSWSIIHSAVSNQWLASRPNPAIFLRYRPQFFSRGSLLSNSWEPYRHVIAWGALISWAACLDYDKYYWSFEDSYMP